MWINKDAMQQFKCVASDLETKIVSIGERRALVQMMDVMIVFLSACAVSGSLIQPEAVANVNGKWYKCIKFGENRMPYNTIQVHNAVSFGLHA